MRITKAQAFAFYADDVSDAIEVIYENLTADIIEAWPQCCFDAMVSFVFNLGPKAFRDPKTGKRTEFWAAAMSADLTLVPKQMQRWVKQGDVVLPGLVSRRGEEAALWGHGLELAQAHATADTPEALDQAKSAIAQQPRAVPDAPAPTRVIEQPAVATAAAAGGVGVATVATTLTAAGTTMTAQSNTLAIVLGAVFILVGVIVLLVVAKRR
jgi:GH24 family phage-related lysozyme (muramidase)